MDANLKNLKRQIQPNFFIQRETGNSKIHRRKKNLLFFIWAMYLLLPPLFFVIKWILSSTLKAQRDIKLIQWAMYLLLLFFFSCLLLDSFVLIFFFFVLGPCVEHFFFFFMGLVCGVEFFPFPLPPSFWGLVSNIFSFFFSLELSFFFPLFSTSFWVVQFFLVYFFLFSLELRVLCILRSFSPTWNYSRPKLITIFFLAASNRLKYHG